MLKPVVEYVFPKMGEKDYVPVDRRKFQGFAKKIIELDEVSGVTIAARGNPKDRSYAADILWVEGHEEDQWERLENRLRSAFPKYAKNIAPKSDSLQIRVIDLPYSSPQVA